MDVALEGVTVAKKEAGFGQDAGSYLRDLFEAWVARRSWDRRRSVTGLAETMGVHTDTVYTLFKGGSDSGITMIVRFLAGVEANGDQVRTFFELVDTSNGRHRFRRWTDDTLVLPPDSQEMIEVLNDLQDSPGITADVQERAERVAGWLSKLLARSSGT